MKQTKKIRVMLAGIFLLQIGLLSGCSGQEVKIYDGEDTVFASLHSSSLEKEKLEEGYRAYAEIVLNEAVQLISEKENCEAEEAEKKLFREQYTIYTVFCPEIYQSLKDACQEYEDEKLSCGCAVTDLKGNLLAVYSAGEGEDAEYNYATVKTPPYSSFKPLSVYAPAIENGIASWSKMYEDSPIKQIEDSEGKMCDWPANATNTYTYEGVSVCTAIQKSLNTVAVKCLQEYGVDHSMQYLEENFGISLDAERSRAGLLGEEEIIGNIALGYLDDGVSPVDMAGYYQAFANGGTYLEPKTIVKICKESGEVVFEQENQGKRVMNVETAFVMNKLLQGVVSQDGTGRNARCEEVPVGGKTGTGDYGNWFVGFTPQYSCAVWHGTEIPENHAPEIFAKAVSSFEHDSSLDFPQCGTVRTAAYCLESGGLITGGCKKVGTGYYTSMDNPLRCNIH